MPSTPTDDLVRKQLTASADRLRQSMNQLEFDEPVSYIYNPLDYAWDLHRQYIELASSEAEVLFLGMNPGPWGMAQSGVPFGEIATVREWLQISGDVCQVDPEHPKRPIEGLDCERSEVSGRRLWGLMRERYETPKAFFQKHFVVNYCPLVFMEESGRNRTPDKLPADERLALQTHCDRHLLEIIQTLPWKHLVGVGTFAETCLKRVVSQLGTESEASSKLQVGRILHPSPASPAANRDWAGTVTSQLIKMEIWQ